MGCPLALVFPLTFFPELTEKKPYPFGFIVGNYILGAEVKEEAHPFHILRMVTGGDIVDL